jgi:hypothetical protein
MTAEDLEREADRLEKDGGPGPIEIAQPDG